MTHQRFNPNNYVTMKHHYITASQTADQISPKTKNKQKKTLDAGGSSPAFPASGEHGSLGLSRAPKAESPDQPGHKCNFRSDRN